MRNFLQHKREIIDNFCNTFKKDGYKTIWGIDLNCNVRLPEIVWMDLILLRFQEIGDCCADCTKSYQPQNCVISQKATLASPLVFPFIPLSIHNQPTTCNYTGGGDFNSDFNSDFYK